jgi:hypothetical protein
VAAELARNGHETHTASVMPDKWRATADVIVGQRVCMPGPTLRWQQLAREGRARLVLELDDDLLGVDPSNAPAWVFFSKPEIRSNLKRNIQIAHAVTVSTPALAERVAQLNPTVHVVPNTVPAWLLELSTSVTGDGPITIGWGGGASHEMDWAEAGSEIASFVTRHPTTEMHIMGWQPPVWQRLPKDRRRFTQWIDSVPDLYRLIDFGIGLAPLRPHLFNQAKSPLKTLEYAALGIPAIASDTGPYPGFERHGGTGFLVRRPHEWARYLRVLLDPDTRREMGGKARAVAAEHTIERNISLWEKAFIG